MKIVLDTNIWISAIIWGGKPDEILRLRKRELFTIAISQQLLNELETTLNKKKFQPKLKALNLTVFSVSNLILKSAILYSIDDLIVPELRDPNDNIILATAIAANADIIITGDQDLLILTPYQNIQIMTAKNFLQQYFNYYEQYILK